MPLTMASLIMFYRSFSSVVNYGLSDRSKVARWPKKDKTNLLLKSLVRFVEEKKMSGNFESKKLYQGYSTCFRQWKARDTHCKFLHGYGVSFEVTFTGELDDRNWIFDFGGLKRTDLKIEGKNPVDYFKWLFDHTVIIAEDDPEKEKFMHLEKSGVLQLRLVEAVGCEQFAKLVYDKLNPVILAQSDGRCKIKSVRFCEHERNSATYFGN